MFESAPDSVLPAPSRERVEKLERFFRVDFPQSFLEFLSHNNGAVPIDGEFESSGQGYLVERFLSVLEPDMLSDPAVNWTDIGVVSTELDERLTEEADEYGLRLIPIAAIFAGDYVCMDYRSCGDGEPTICVWYHEESEELAPFTQPVATSFERFLAMLG